MSDSTPSIVHKELSYQIVGASMTVLNELKPGLDEKVYENALVLELKHLGLRVEQQKSYPVFYRESLVGKLIPDLIVEDKVIVDPKVVTAFVDSHLAQMNGYLAITKLDLAILLNFKYEKLVSKRIVRSSLFA
jgi:GxxExxY protein